MKCKLHPKYMGRNKPKVYCEVCWRLWKWSRFSSWAMNEGWYPEDIKNEEFVFVSRHKLAIDSICTDIERDLYGK